MENNNLNNFIKGWFIGDFKPTILNTSDFEIAIKCGSTFVRVGSSIFK